MNKSVSKKLAKKIIKIAQNNSFTVAQNKRISLMDGSLLNNLPQMREVISINHPCNVINSYTAVFIKLNSQRLTIIIERFVTNYNDLFSVIITNIRGKFPIFKTTHAGAITFILRDYSGTL